MSGANCRAARIVAYLRMIDANVPSWCDAGQVHRDLASQRSTEETPPCFFPDCARSSSLVLSALALLSLSVLCTSQNLQRRVLGRVSHPLIRLLPRAMPLQFTASQFRPATAIGR